MHAAALHRRPSARAMIPSGHAAAALRRRPAAASHPPPRHTPLPPPASAPRSLCRACPRAAQRPEGRPQRPIRVVGRPQRPIARGRAAGPPAAARRGRARARFRAVPSVTAMWPARRVTDPVVTSRGLPWPTLAEPARRVPPGVAPAAPGMLQTRPAETLRAVHPSPRPRGRASLRPARPGDPAATQTAQSNRPERAAPTRPSAGGRP
jgi:hypothetical protein